MTLGDLCNANGEASVDMQATHHQPGGNGLSDGVLIPRWLEIKDHRDGAQENNPLRSTFYVVSPDCSLEDARVFARHYNQRDRMERTFSLLMQGQAVFTVALLVTIIVIVLSQASWLWLLGPIAIFTIYQLILKDASDEVLKPFDVQEIGRQTETPMLFRVHIQEYLAATRFAARNPSRAGEVHRLMWRVCALDSLYATAERELGLINQAGNLRERDLSQARLRLGALHNLILDAKESLQALINPPRMTNPLQRERLLELLHEINTALSQGVDDLVPRIEKQTQRLQGNSETQESGPINGGTKTPPAPDYGLNQKGAKG